MGGGGSSGQSQQSSQQSATNNFSSSPLNLQNPAFQNMAQPTANALWNAIQNPYPGNNFGTAQGNISPFGWGPGQTPYANTANNPLVANITGGQQAALNNVNAAGNPYQAGNPAYYSAYNANQANLTASANPLTGGISGQAGQQLANTAGAGFGSAANTANLGAYGAGANYLPAWNQTGQAVNTANTAFAPGAAQAGAAGNTANNNFNPAYGQAGATANAANYGNFGQGTAGTAADYANANPFGRGMAANANQTANSVAGAGQPALNAAQGTLNFGGPQGGFGQSTSRTAADFANSGQLYGMAQPALQNILDPNYAARLATSPQTMAAVQGAINPMINAFNAQTVPGLSGMFTSAGQRVNQAAGGGVGGSSAFNTAGANALTGLEGQIGATAQGIINPAYQTGLQQNANAINQAQSYGTALEQGMQGAAQTQLSTSAGKTAAEQAQAQTAAGIQAQQAGAQTAAAQTEAQVQAAKSAALNQAAQTQAATQGAQVGAMNAAGQLQTAVPQAQAAAQTGAANTQTANAAGAAGAQTAAAQQATALPTAQTGALNQSAQTQAGVQTAQANALAQAAQTNAGLVSGTIANMATAASTGAGVQSQLVNNTINTLNANALPQLTQQYGINQGLQLYNTQVNQMLTAMGLATQAAQPSIANIASGFGQSSGSGSGSSSSKGGNVFGL